MSNAKITRLAKELNALKGTVSSMNSPQLAYSSLEDGAINEYDVDGKLVSIIGKQADGSHTYNPVAGPIPPKPIGVSVTGGAGVFRVAWNGEFEYGNVAPYDFARVEVHVSDSPGFEFDPLPNSATRADSIESAGGGEVAIVRPAGTYYIKLLSRSQPGKFSQPSEELSIVVDPVVSPAELEAILIEVEQANTDLAGLQITLGDVQTDLENAQELLDSIENIDGRIGSLENTAGALAADIANAEQAAANAQTQATAAASTASAAQAAADAAATAANNAAAEAGAATQAAQEAEHAALEAADLVAGKSTVYYGSTPPAGDASGLWIKDGKPYLWDGTEWVESENADLVQAATDAAQAKTQAAQALSTANQAAQDAANAQDAAAQAAQDAAGAQTAAQSALSAATSAETAANAAALSAGNAEDASSAASAAAGAAQLAAGNAQTVATQAQAAAAGAVADADAALLAAQEAVTAGQNAQTTANSAVTTANNALIEAADAADAAATAITAANSATTAAQSAQDAADNANAEALAAAGLAEAKGEVIYQATAPTGSRAVKQNLWIRTTDNKPHTYDGTKWVAVTDKAATDAAASAATANSTATNAWNLANTANGTANTALSTANGKNRVTYSPNAPGTAANTQGDIWFRKDANNVIIGQWEGLGGTSWAAKTLGNTVIANLDAGKITSGYIDAARINAGTITVGMIKPGDVATPSQVNTAKSEAISAATAYTDGATDPINTTLTLWKHPDGTLIDGGKIYTNTITANQIAAGTITANELATNSVTAAKITAGAVVAGKIAANAVTATTIAANAVTAGKIAADAITARELAANSVTASEIAANAVVAGKIAAGAVTAGTIAADAVAAGTVAADAITGREIKALSIGSEHVIAGSIVADKIATGAITADKLAANSITAAKIVALTITGDKIAANAISADKITANAITADKIAANAVTTAKLNALAVTADKIAANAITAEKIQAGAIDVGKLKAGTLSANNITAGTLTAAIAMSTGGSLTVGSTAADHVLIANSRIDAYKSIQGLPTNTVSIGAGADAFSVRDAYGAELGAIHSDGSMKNTGMVVDGDLILEGDNLRDILDPLSAGAHVWSANDPTVRGPYSNTTGIWEFAFDATGGRRYRIEIVSDYRPTGHTNVIFGLRKTSAAPGTTPPAPTVGLSPFVAERPLRGVDGYWQSGTMSWFYSPTNSEATRWLVTINSSGSASTRNFQVVVTDLGVNPQNTGRHSLGGASGTVVDPTPPLKDYVKEFYFDTHQVWTQFGKGDSYAPQWIRSGTASHINSVYRTYLPLPAAALSTIAGADSVQKIELRLAQHQGYNGSPAIGGINTTSVAGSTEPAMYDVHTPVSYKYGDNKWFTIGSTLRNNIASGTRKGISVGRTTAVTLQDFQGTGASTSVRPKIRIHYKA